MWRKAESSVSHDLSEIILICWFRTIFFFIIYFYAEISAA